MCSYFGDIGVTSSNNSARQDCLIALNRVTGALVWENVMPEEPMKYGSTVSPLIVNDTVIAGVSGGDWGIRGFIICYKADTGEKLWRYWTIPEPR